MALFFVHIPKTAGTSFRLGAERHFGSDNIIYDYGTKARETSEMVKETLYGDHTDLWKFGQRFHEKGAALVAGHVNIGRFVSIFGAQNTVTFLRDPLQRMASEYAHFVRHFDYKGSFKEFYSRPVMQNRQSKILHGVNLEAIGLLGLTERYADSLELINALYGIDILHREDNQGKSSLAAPHKFTAEDEAELKRLNHRDITSYKYSKQLFDIRMELFRDGLPYAHAHLVEAGKQRVAGWAWWAGDNDAPVEVEVWINSDHVSTVPSIDHRPGLCRLLPPRGGYVGFHLPVKLNAGDKVQCRVARTGQRFPPQPRRVVESQDQ
ncbi:sulfotransferase family 2 domain-containing protein [Halomonas huangheensis]|uniref:Sulfotransferase family protein n=1 Tax=Halomonas huangheensis TaxID=1178482 RepID=W1NA23_9GAMM|nr:sulfotransferase family 2 domain-containing protein [Halomonas huangheensis]ALM53723.1 hypothetical protein AR456_16655 [Halomonas huangheensis]ERL52364.1 hypothetical protein BJB45_10380 [Halomonas huangheensis]